MIQGIHGIDLSVGKIQSVASGQTAGAEKSFSEILSNAFEKVKELEQDSSTKQMAFAAGENVELHDVVIAMEKYSVAMDLLMSVRNKVIEAYQEISRMQV